MAKESKVENEKKVLRSLVDFSWHIGKKLDGFEEIHGGFGISKRNVEGLLLLEFCVEKFVGNVCFKK